MVLNLVSETLMTLKNHVEGSTRMMILSKTLNSPLRIKEEIFGKDPWLSEPNRGGEGSIYRKKIQLDPVVTSLGESTKIGIDQKWNQP